MIRIRCQFEIPLCRYELDDYVRGLELSVVGYSELGEEVVLGRMEADLLHVSLANEDNQSLIQVCDYYSGELVNLFVFLFEENGFMKEMSVDNNTDHILFLWRAAFHPSIRPFQSNILNCLPGMFGNDCAMVMQRSTCQLDDRELVDLGYSKLAGTEFLFRHMSFINEFTRVHPRGMEDTVGFEANENDGDWIEDHWDMES